ncbi:MAG: AzlC family ABC transporter permease [Pseudomonadota bacterium]
MRSTTTKSQVLRGAREGTPFLLIVVPFAMLFGVVGTEAGLNLREVMAFSVLVIAGASQFAAVQLMAESAPTLIVIVTALAVNLRMAMYSASLAVYLGAAPFWQRALIAYCNVDQTYAMSVQKYEKEPQMTVSERVAYFFGVALPVFPSWVLCTYLGAVAGTAIPPEYALDFALPIAFLAITAPMLRTLAHVAAAIVSVVVALTLAGLPAGTGLLLAAAAAMLTGSEVERRFGDRWI